MLGLHILHTTMILPMTTIEKFGVLEKVGSLLVNPIVVEITHIVVHDNLRSRNETKHVTFS